jgi:hypothetical protein
LEQKVLDEQRQYNDRFGCGRRASWTGTTSSGKRQNLGIAIGWGRIIFMLSG